MNAQVSMYLDTRRAKNGNLFPVKIRVWDNLSKKAKLYPTNINVTEKEFSSAWQTLKPRKEFADLRLRLETIKGKANDSIKELNPFSFEAFERRLFRKTGEGTNIRYHYIKIIEEKIKQGQIGTASNYDLSLKSIDNFLTNLNGKTNKLISFYEISPSWLKDYEKFMLKTGKSLSTVGIYLRPLRAVFNKAIIENEIKSEIYPFGKRKYQVPASRNIKKALTKDQLKTLFKSNPSNDEQQKAKDFWFFSYGLNGINIKDIAQLKYKDISNEGIKFYRAKTINSTKGNLKPISAPLTDFSKGVISKYGNPNIEADGYVFDVLNGVKSPTDQKRAVQNFTRFINQHIKKLCKENGLPEISTYWARHSFATNAVRSGASMELIQESLGHGDMKTTMNYFAGFEDSTKQELANKLMDFM